MTKIKVLKKDDLANKLRTARSDHSVASAAFDKLKAAATVQAWVAGWRSQKQTEAQRARAIYTRGI
jgi:hypothetical protein